MNANQAGAKVRTMCRVLGVSASGYYAWRDRAPSARTLADAVLVERIRRVHADSHQTYGMPRVRAELIDQGVAVSRKRVARLMRTHAIRGISRRRGFVVTTRRQKGQGKAPDLVQRRFDADGPDRLWVADLTYVPTWAGFIYLAVVLDAWSRRVVGWAIGETMTAELVLQALNMALQQRRPDGVIHHSDQGSQYASIAFGERCRRMGVRPSMGSVGDAADQDRSTPGAVHLHRGLVQPAPAPQRPPIPLADQLREQARRAAIRAPQTRVAHRRHLRGSRHAAGGQLCTGKRPKHYRAQPVTVRGRQSTPPPCCREP